MSPYSLVLITMTLFGVGCGGQVEPAEPDEPDWLQLETGRACAKAEVACAPGNCAANVDNKCSSPVTCDLKIECICQGHTGEEAPATATSGDNTILSGERVGLAAKVICEAGDVLATIARTVHCF